LIGVHAELLLGIELSRVESIVSKQSHSLSVSIGIHLTTTCTVISHACRRPCIDLRYTPHSNNIRKHGVGRSLCPSGPFVSEGHLQYFVLRLAPLYEHRHSAYVPGPEGASNNAPEGSLPPPRTTTKQTQAYAECVHLQTGVARVAHKPVRAIRTKRVSFAYELCRPPSK